MAMLNNQMVIHMFLFLRVLYRVVCFTITHPNPSQSIPRMLAISTNHPKHGWKASICNPPTSSSLIIYRILYNYKKQTTWRWQKKSWDSASHGSGNSNSLQQSKHGQGNNMRSPIWPRELSTDGELSVISLGSIVWSQSKIPRDCALDCGWLHSINILVYKMILRVLFFYGMNLRVIYGMVRQV